MPRTIVFPSAKWGTLLPETFNLSGEPACTSTSSGTCYYGMNLNPENFLPAPSGTTLYNQAIGVHTVNNCSTTGANWTDFCPGTIEVEYDNVGDLLPLANHWLVISASVGVAPDGETGDGSKDYVEYTEIAIRVVIGCASDPSAPGCQPPLKVFVKQLEPLRSGLAVHSVHYKDNLVDFTASAPSSGLPTSHYVCQSAIRSMAPRR